MVSADPVSAPRTHRRIGQSEMVLVALFAMLVLQRPLIGVFDQPALATWSTMFVALVVQALPFMLVGVLLAAVISVFLSERALARLTPRRPALAVPAAGLAGVALPGCECASVPVAGSLIGRGVAPAAALTFLLAAPAVNPVVLASTAVAFSGSTEMVAARFAASMLTAIAVGWIWVALGARIPMRIRTPRPHAHGGRMGAFAASVQHDFLHTTGYLIAGGMIAAAVNTFVPSAALDAVADNAVIAVLVLAAFAFVVALCSEADAFIAASLTAFSDTAKLAFMVVGPAADVKLAAMQAGTFGPRFAVVFIPLTVTCALLSVALVGWWLL